MTIKTLIAKRDEVVRLFDQQAEIKANAENDMAVYKAQYNLLNELIELEESKKKKEDK
jgi:hypothetical protein